MATDGVKIIDSDLAHDTYWGILDMYDNGIDIESILKEYPFQQQDCYDDFDYEIYLTSLALAFWEIGIMNDSLLAHVKNVINKETSFRIWSEESDEKLAKQRWQILNRFIKKISSRKNKVRKPMKYRKVKNFHFNTDDLLTFKLEDNLYRAIICTKTVQYRGECSYYFVDTTYLG